MAASRITLSVTIDNASVTLNSDAPCVFEKNLRGESGIGSITVQSTRATRYEPYTYVVVTFNDVTQTPIVLPYVVQSDEVQRLKDDEYEHVISLQDPIMYFKAVFPADRSFTVVPSMSIADIFAVYARELLFYQGITVELSDYEEELYAVTMPERDYSAMDFMSILVDLFRRIDAFPTATYSFSTEEWTISHRRFNYDSNGTAITTAAHAENETANDIAYGTQVHGQARGAVREDENGTWFPSVDGWITPRAIGTLLRTSELQFQFPHPIHNITHAYCLVPCEARIVDEPSPVNIEVLVDFAGSIVTKDEWDKLDVHIYNNDWRQMSYTHYSDPGLHSKQNTLYYDIKSMNVDNVFSAVSGLLGFTENVLTLNHAINYWLFPCARDQFDIDWAGYGEAALTPDWEKTVSPPYAVYTNLDDIDSDLIPCRFYFKTDRDFDFIIEKNEIGLLNKASVMNSQRGSSSEASRYLEASQSFVDRIGTPIDRKVQFFSLVNDVWKIGDTDSASGKKIIDIKYNVLKTGVSVTAEFAKGAANINSQYSVTREPRAYLVGGVRAHTHPVYREYLVMQKASGTDDSTWSGGIKDSAMNMLGWASGRQYTVRHANIIPVPTDTAVFTGSEAIDALVFGCGSGSAVVMSFQFRHPTIAGYGKVEIDSAWYKNPVKYTYGDDAELTDFDVRFNNSVALIASTATEEFHPLVVKSSPVYNHDVFPIDKDPNATAGLTVEIIGVSAFPDDIIVGNGWAKFNPLINDYASAPTLAVYVSTADYTIYDKRNRGTLDTGATVAYDSGHYDITLSGAHAGKNWQICYNGEMILAGNNETYAIHVYMTKVRP